MAKQLGLSSDQKLFAAVFVPYVGTYTEFVVELSVINKISEMINDGSSNQDISDYLDSQTDNKEMSNFLISTISHCALPKWLEMCGFHYYLFQTTHTHRVMCIGITPSVLNKAIFEYRSL